MRLSIGRATTLLAAAVLLAYLATAGASRYILDELRIGGLAYQNIVAGKDFVSDLLPPPLFLVEAYLDTELSAVGKLDVPEAKARLEALHKSYDERKAFWSTSPHLPENLLTLANGAAAKEADKFWQEVTTVYIPAIERDDRATATASLAKIDALFAAHYKLVDQQVEKANAFSRSTEQNALALGSRLDTLSLAATIIVAALLIGVILLAQRRLVSPITTLSAYMARLSQGHVADAAPYPQRRDEIGQMNAAVEIFRDTLTKVRMAETQAAEQNAKSAEQLKEREAGAKWYIENRDFFFKEYTAAMERLSAGDLEVRLEKEFIKDYEKLRAQFNAAVERMQSTMKSIAATCGTMDSSTHEISRASEDLSQRNEEQAATLAQTASAVNQITNTVKKTADSAIEAREVVGAAKTDAVKGEKIVGEAIDAMGGIEKSSEQISQIIGVIDEIAFQTNLLALNAGVEAARAGEAGRGFAVVATEVRALAQRSAEAAKEIKTLITASNAKVQDGVALVAETGASLHRIVEQVNKINAVVTQIAESAEAQSNSLREVNTAVQEIDQVTQKNAAMSEETNAASRSLAEDSVELTSLIHKFKIGADISHSAAKRRVAARPALKQVARSGSAARKMDEAPRDESWEEF